MARQEINLGTQPTGVGGDTARSANVKVNANFVEVYTALNGLGTASRANLTTTRDDKTQGAALKVGDYGIGLQLSTRSIIERRLPITRGNGVSFDLLAGGERPTGVIDGPMLTLSNDTTQGVHLLIDWRNGTIYTYPDIAPAPVKKWVKQYNEDNIAGLITDGGAMEAGTNSYGKYTKLRDGTLICYGEAQPLNGVGPNVAASNPATIFAHAFLAGTIPSISVMCGPSNSADQYGVTGINFAAADIATRFSLTVKNGPVGQNYRFWFMAVGRWK